MSDASDDYGRGFVNGLLFGMLIGVGASLCALMLFFPRLRGIDVPMTLTVTVRGDDRAELETRLDEVLHEFWLDTAKRKTGTGWEYTVETSDTGKHPKPAKSAPRRRGRGADRR